MKQYKVLYRTGFEVFSWREAEGFDSWDAADVRRKRLRLMGHQVLIVTADQFLRIGLPKTRHADEYFQVRGLAPIGQPVMVGCPACGGDSYVEHPDDDTQVVDCQYCDENGKVRA